MTTSNTALYCWDDKVLYIGKEVGRGLRSHKSTPTSILVSGLSGNVTFFNHYDDEKNIDNRCVFFQAGSSWSDCYKDDLVCFFMVDPLSPLNQILLDNTKKMTVLGRNYLNNQDQWLELLAFIYQHRPERDDVERYIDQFFSSDHFSSYSTKIDYRIISLSKILKNNFVIKKSTEELAEQLNLSKVHLMQLFKKEVGIPIGRYILWRRVANTIKSVMEGKNITDSAMEAGFTDTPHFSRVFKDFIGAPPSNFWPKGDCLEKIKRESGTRG